MGQTNIADNESEILENYNYIKNNSAESKNKSYIM